MTYDPQQHHRHSIRLQGYDYTQAGAYFVTICTQNREPLLQPCAVSEMITHWWYELAQKFPCVSLDAFVIMPNHVHGIIVLSQPAGDQEPVSLAAVVQWFKMMTTNAYIRGVKAMGWTPFHGRVWQRNYYEHIIRNERAMQAIRVYIEANPVNWEEDQYHLNVR